MKKLMMVTTTIAMMASTSAFAWGTHSWGGGNSYTSFINADSSAGNVTDGAAAAVGASTATGTLSGGASGQLTAVATDNNGNAMGMAAAGEVSGSAAGAMAADPNNASTQAVTSSGGGSDAEVTTGNRWSSWRRHH